MQRITEAVPCALCRMPAKRRPLRSSSDGYLYDCAACGGRYSIGLSALSHAESGQAHPDILPAVRSCLAHGDLPRVAIVGGPWQPLEIIGRHDPNSEPA